MTKEEYMKRLNERTVDFDEDPNKFVRVEALKILHTTENEDTALKALNVLANSKLFTGEGKDVAKEALKIFHATKNKDTALKALEIMLNVMY